MTYIENSFPIKEISDLALREGNSKRPVYQLHKWWARRLSAVVRGLLIAANLPYNSSQKDFWKQYYSANQLDGYTVMDIFMGGGSSLVEAKKMGAKTIGVDIDPLACFITRKELESANFDQLKEEYNSLQQRISAKIRSMYLTEVNGKSLPVINYFWVYKVECPECNSSFEAHPHYKIFESKEKQGVICSHCGKLHYIAAKQQNFVCEDCQLKTIIATGPFKRGKCTCTKCNFSFALKDHLQGNKSLHLFALEYESNGKRNYKEATDADRSFFQQVEVEFAQNKNLFRIPDAAISVANEKERRPVSHGYKKHKDLFNSRQLYTLGILLNEILSIQDTTIQSWFLLAFSDSLASNNMLCSYAYGYQKLTPLFGIHAYTVPARPVENNVWGTGGLGRGTFEKTFNKMLKSKAYCDTPYELKLKGKTPQKILTGEKISSIVTHDFKMFYQNKADALILNQSSEKLNEINDQSVDLILTDPPYYDNLHYSHLADFYMQWLNGHIFYNNTDPTKNSLFAQNDADDSLALFTNRLKTIFQEAYKKLKPDGMMIFSYHHNKENAWRAIAEALKESGFIITKVFPIRSEGQSAYHTSEQSIKWDSIIVARKTSREVDCHNLQELLSKWERYINQEKLELNYSDKLSFYRSLAVQVYTASDKELGSLFKDIQSFPF